MATASFALSQIQTYSSPPKSQKPPAHIRGVERIWALAALPRGSRWCIPSLTTAALAVACFSLLWHPTYYIHQSTFWASHMVLILPL